MKRLIDLGECYRISYHIRSYVVTPNKFLILNSRAMPLVFRKDEAPDSGIFATKPPDIILIDLMYNYEVVRLKMLCLACFWRHTAGQLPYGGVGQAHRYICTYAAMVAPAFAGAFARHPHAPILHLARDSLAVFAWRSSARVGVRY